MPDLYYFEVLNPVNADKHAKQVIPAEGNTEREARQRVLDEADRHPDALQMKRGERLGRVTEVFRSVYRSE
jgi:hypothetical protein